MRKPMKQMGVMLLVSMFTMIVMAVGVSAQTQRAKPYFTGDGGKGIRLAVIEPVSKGLSKDDQWILSLVQGSITGDFNKFSGMTIIDRQNLEKVFAEWEQSMSGNYSEADFVKIGNLTNASHILTGNISKTAKSLMIEFAVTELASGERKASYSPKPVSLLTLEDLSAVKEASADILRQLGVELTDEGLGELKRTENVTKMQAETMLARGITAQKQGTEVAALSYFFQAAILDPSLAEAVNRSSVMAANISSGNIGEKARNDIAWRKAWIKRLEETERYFDNLNKTISMPYTLFYSDEIIQGDINYQNETMTLSIKTNLYGNGSIKAWAVSVEQALLAVYNGLAATQRKEAWGLKDWPTERVTDLNPFTMHAVPFTIVVELVNSKNKIIGRHKFITSGYYEYFRNGWIRPRERDQKELRPSIGVFADGRRVYNEIEFADIMQGKRSVIELFNESDSWHRWGRYKEKKQVDFTYVKADDITDNLTIRFASVNGEVAEIAAKKGRLQIKAVSKSEFDTNDAPFTSAFGEIQKYNGSGSNLVIPNTIWDDRITSIADNVFRKHNLTSVTIPNGVTSIGKEAFANNRLTNVIIPNSVTSIGSGAFAYNQLISVIIPSSVTYIGYMAFMYNQLTNVIIHNGVTTIGGSAFQVNQLTSIIIPSSVTYIGKEAFNNNELTNITIGSNVTFPNDGFYKVRPFENFCLFYLNNGSKAGTYTRNGGDWLYTPSR